MTSSISDRQSFEQAILANAADATPWLVMADWLEEKGETELAGIQRHIGALLRDDGEVWNRLGEDEHFAAYRRFLQVVSSHGDTEARLARANGRRRTRTLVLAELIDIAIDALRDEDGWQSIGGGTVANAYGYRSYQTVALAVRRSDGRVRIGVAEVSGSKGSSRYTPFGLLKNSKPSAFLAWANEETAQ